jgi:hypothetical protein
MIALGVLPGKAMSDKHFIELITVEQGRLASMVRYNFGLAVEGVEHHHWRA